jgi:hypothetical protein
MKQINPNTGVPFKRGDMREDGLLFIQYLTTQKNEQGYFKLKFGPKSWIEKSNKTATAWQKANKDIHNKRNLEQRYASPRQRAVSMLTGARNRANKKGFECSLTKIWIIHKLENGFCELSGIPFDFSRPTKSNFNPLSPSIDRIDSKKGYTFDNCRVILTALNVALSEYGLDLYLEIAKKVISSQNKPM